MKMLGIVLAVVMLATVNLAVVAGGPRNFNVGQRPPRATRPQGAVVREPLPA
jgi:hypothetical protein